MEINLEVDGLPPGKDGGLSIFKQKHRQHGRVEDLLSKAKRTKAYNRCLAVESYRAKAFWTRTCNG